MPQVVASERGKAQTVTVKKPAGVAVTGLWDGTGRGCGSFRKSQNPGLAEAVWKDPPKRVIAP